MNAKSTSTFVRACLGIAAAIAFACVAHAATESVDGIPWTYTINDGVAELFDDYNAVIPDTTAGAITIPSTLGGCPVTRIGNYAFVSCRSLTKVTIPEGVNSIGWYAFMDCTSLAEVVIPASATDIDQGVFYGCDALADDAGFVIIGGVLYAYLGSATDVAVPAGVTCIWDNAFYVGDAKNVTSVALPESVTTIGKAAFYGCNSLTNMTVPASVTYIGGFAFGECTALPSVTYLGACPETGGQIYYRVSGELVSLVPADADGWADALANGKWQERPVRTPSPTGEVLLTFDPTDGYCDSAFRQIGRGVAIGKLPSARRDGYSLTGWWTEPDGGVQLTADSTIDADFTCYAHWIENSETIDGIKWLFTVHDDGWVEISNGYDAAIPTNTTGAIAVPATLGGLPVKQIGFSAFANCASITSVTIPKGVTDIGEYSFTGCKSLTKVTIPDSVTRIGWYAFEDCISLADVAIPASVERIGEGAFRNCVTLADANGFIIKNGILWQYLGDATHVTIPSGVTRIDSGAFGGNETLTGVTIPASVTEIGSSAFSHCTSLAAVTIPSGVVLIERYAFEYCSSLKKVTYSGPCPKTDYDLYVNANEELVSLVPLDAEGWADALAAGTWQNRPIKIAGEPVPGTLTMTAEEVNGGERMKVTVKRTVGEDGRIAVKLKTQDASTVNGVNGRFGIDFEYMKDYLEWKDGDTSDKVVYVQTYVTDATSATTFRLKLSVQTTGDYADCATPTLTDGGKVIATINPANKGIISFVAPDPMSVVAGNTLKVTIRRTGGSDGRVAVKFKTQDASTVSGISAFFLRDFDYVKKYLVWEHGDASDRTVEVPTVAGWWSGDPKTFRLKLSVQTTGDYANCVTPTLASGGKVIASILSNDAAYPGEVKITKVESIRNGSTLSGTVTSAPFWGYAGDTLRVTASRTGGSFGRVAVKVKTQDASTVGSVNGLFNIDMGYAKETFMWKDGDTADRVLEIPTFHVDGAVYPHTFRLKLSAQTTGDYANCATPAIPDPKVIVSLKE